MIYVFLANGFEEIEAITPIDILRRGGVEVMTVGINGKIVVGSHNIPIECDIEINDVSIRDMQGIILPGGIPGTPNIERCGKAIMLIKHAIDNDLLVCAICAAPSILGKRDMLNGKNATCYPGYEDLLNGAVIYDEKVVKDGNIITSKGAGTAAEFSFEILTYLKGKVISDKIKAQMQY